MLREGRFTQILHPTHCKKGIPFGQFLRLRRICSRDADFQRHALIKAAHYLARGYPLTLVTEACVRAWEEGNPNLPPKQNSDSGKEYPNILVTTFHPTFNNLSKIVKKNWDILARSSRAKTLHEKPLIVSLRRPPNLKSHLVWAKTIFDPDNPDQGKYPSAVLGRTYNICHNNECRYCPKLNCGGKITSTTTNRSYI